MEDDLELCSSSSCAYLSRAAVKGCHCDAELWDTGDESKSVEHLLNTHKVKAHDSPTFTAWLFCCLALTTGWELVFPRDLAEALHHDRILNNRGKMSLVFDLQRQPKTSDKVKLANKDEKERKGQTLSLFPEAQLFSLAILFPLITWKSVQFLIHFTVV